METYIAYIMGKSTQFPCLVHGNGVRLVGCLYKVPLSARAIHARKLGKVQLNENSVECQINALHICICAMVIMFRISI